MGVLALLAVGLGFWLHSLNAQERWRRRQMDAFEGEDRAVSAGALANEARSGSRKIWPCWSGASF